MDSISPAHTIITSHQARLTLTHLVSAPPPPPDRSPGSLSSSSGPSSPAWARQSAGPARAGSPGAAPSPHSGIITGVCVLLYQAQRVVHGLKEWFMHVCWVRLARSSRSTCWGLKVTAGKMQNKGRHRVNKSAFNRRDLTTEFLNLNAKLWII